VFFFAGDLVIKSDDILFISDIGGDGDDLATDVLAVGFGHGIKFFFGAASNVDLLM